MRVRASEHPCHAQTSRFRTHELQAAISSILTCFSRSSSAACSAWRSATPRPRSVASVRCSCTPKRLTALQHATLCDYNSKTPAAVQATGGTAAAAHVFYLILGGGESLVQSACLIGEAARPTRQQVEQTACTMHASSSHEMFVTAMQHSDAIHNAPCSSWHGKCRYQSARE